jgi:hypothetical protein
VGGIALPEDPRTVPRLAEGLFMSETRLRTSCRRAGFKGLAVLRLIRVLRARRLVLETKCRWQDALDIADDRTFTRLLARSGVLPDGGSPPPLDQTLAGQTILVHTELLSQLKRALQD